MGHYSPPTSTTHISYTLRVPSPCRARLQSANGPATSEQSKGCGINDAAAGRQRGCWRRRTGFDLQGCPSFPCAVIAAPPPFLISLDMGSDIWVRPLGPIAPQGAAWMHFPNVAEAVRYLRSEEGGSLRIQHTQVTGEAGSPGTHPGSGGSTEFCHRFREPHGEPTRRARRVKVGTPARQE